MKVIDDLADFIEDELDDVEKYAKKAMCYKESYPMVAELLYSLSTEEMKHKNQLHNMVVKLIDDVHQSGEEVPEWMMRYYDRIHQKHIEHETEGRMVQTMFRE